MAIANQLGALTDFINDLRSPAMHKPGKPTLAQYEAAARAHGWYYSKAHGAWVHDDERDHSKGEAAYVLQRDAEDACWFHEIDVDPSTPVED